LHITEREIRGKYRYSNLSYVFDVYMECEYRANLTQEEYDGLLPGEFRFDYKSWGYRLGFTKAQMERAIKELTTENIVIIQVEKGKKGSSSKYFLARFKDDFEKNNKKHNEKNNKRTINVENTSVEGNQEEQKENNNKNKKRHSSRYNNLDIESNNIYSHWNSKKIIRHKELSEEMKKAINKALKKYSEDEIIQAINTYDEILKSDFFFNYKWSLTDFLNRKNGISTFTEEGSNKANYDTWNSKQNINVSESSYRIF